MCVRPTDEADIERQRCREAARMYRDRHHISVDDTISTFDDLSVFGGSLDTVEQVLVTPWRATVCLEDPLTLSSRYMSHLGGPHCVWRIPRYCRAGTCHTLEDLGVSGGSLDTVEQVLVTRWNRWKRFLGTTSLRWHLVPLPVFICLTFCHPVCAHP